MVISPIEKGYSNPPFEHCPPYVDKKITSSLKANHPSRPQATSPTEPHSLNPELVQSTQNTDDQDHSCY
jgi:hypothetical protein